MEIPVEPNGKTHQLELGLAASVKSGLNKTEVHFLLYNVQVDIEGCPRWHCGNMQHIFYLVASAFYIVAPLYTDFVSKFLNSPV